jgi:hypothetical protein
MTTHVDELTSDVSVEPEPAPGSAAGPAPDWEAQARLREQLCRLKEDAWRTAAEGFDD